MTSRPRLAGPAEAALAGGVLILAAAAFAWGAHYLPALDTLTFGYDWHNYWVMFKGGPPDYARVDVFNPPWALAVIWPLAALPFKTGWALLACLTLLVFILAAPPRSDGRPDLALILGLLLAFWTLRQIADGNLAALVVAGFLLMRAGWERRSAWQVAAGVLLATAKPQEGGLAVLALGLAMLQSWPARRWLAAAGWASLGALPPLMAWGGPWLDRLLPGGQLSGSVARTFNNISLAGLAGVGWPSWAVLGAALLVAAVTAGLWFRERRRFPPELAGLLAAAGLLLSPYANSTSLAVVLAVSVAPLVRGRPPIGWGLLALAFAPYVTAQPNTAAAWPESWQTAYLGLVWAAAAWAAWRAEPAP